MNEQEETTATENDGVLPTTTPLIDIANASAERMEKANEETEKLLARQEALEQRRALGGRAEAGQTPQGTTEEEKKQKGAEEFFAGTQLERDIKQANA